MPNPTTTRLAAHLNLDVLILGGGIMGLWLAHELHEGNHRFALLERNELGGDQTCHSHVYLHQGYIYNELGLAARLRSVTAKWKEWLRPRPHLVRSGVSYFGFRSPADYEDKRALWDDPALALQCQPIAKSEWPLALAPSTVRSSGVRVLVSTPEQSLDGHLLVKELAGEFPDSIFRIDGLDRIEVTPAGVVGIARNASCGDLRFRARYLILAGGAGNWPLIARFFPDEFAGRACPQQIRKANMLVLRGKKSDLPPVTGVFGSFGGLFIVSRELGSENAWLVSDYRSPLAGEDGVGDSYGPTQWVPAVIEYLHDLAPAVMDRASKLRWGIYEAPKAEGAADGKLPEEERITAVARGAWAVWPTKLTLAPQASEVLLRNMDLKRGATPTRVRPVVNSFERPGVAPERWTRTPLCHWSEF